ncbi:hypothetical protein VP1G_10781 [Cytospora mali]|uniref:Pfs domain protein n=1 Tax=Cytospora mali TaxID=578113 RepID=A0A194UWG1_CYTMA|nr:hypothetical protein VP1G_10781 [Valsa mali var. pyri (nom. inval.)]
MTSESPLKIINRSLPYKNGIPKPEDGAKEPNNSSGSIDALPSRTMPLFAVSQESESANLQVNIDKPQELVHINSTTESEWTSNTRSTFDASTDSGYGSIPPQRLKKLIHAALKRPSVGNPAGGNQLGGSHGISTTYSDAQCIQDDDCRTRYLTEIYEELSGMFPESLPSAELPRLESTLPVLLKAFAVKLGFSDTSPDHRTVAYLVHSHYDQITEALLHVSIEDEANEDESTLLPINSRMSLKDKMSMWDEKEGADDLVPRSMSPPSVCDGEVLAEYDTNGTLLDGTWVSGFMTADEIKITVSGTTCSIAEIGEILAWMRTALSGGFSHLDRVWTGTPVLQASNSSMKVLSRLDPGEVPLVPHSSQPGSCWYNILGNVVSVKGYPTKRRPEHHTGIELPLPMMVPLANARRLSRFKGMLCIKGYCSIVVPTRRQGGFIYWHLITNSDGEHISYTDGRVVTLAETYPQDLSIEDLRTSRHILGWTPQVENLTGSSDARYGIRWSGLSRPRPGCAFEKVSITGGSFVTAGVSAILGKKDKSVQMQSRDDYIMRLKWISKKFVVLYDVHERRAWLVDGASALLHLVRASLKHDASDFFKDLLLSNSSSLQESPEPFTGKPAAIRILTNKANLSLPLYAKPAESKIEETTTDIGTQNKILSTTTHYTFKDRVEDIYERLEQIIAHQADVSSEDGIGFRISLTLRRQLEGFDFMDVATDEDPIWPRVTTVRARGRGWIDLTRALHSITLFGTGFGELFRPTQRSGNCSNCLANSEVPKGEDYLAVCTRELREILEKRGSKETNPWKLIDDIYWHTPDMSFEPCRCKKFSVRKHDRIQVLLPSSLPKFWGRGFKSPVHLAPQGAVLFGHSWRFPLRWKDGGLPEEGEPDDELEDMEACFQDSGLGTSPESSSATADEPSQSDQAQPYLAILPLLAILWNRKCLVDQLKDTKSLLEIQKI